jgi:hypothetical protein
MARTTNKAEDLLTFTRASTGTALTKVAYGPELVTNGTFDSDLTGWTVNGAGASAAVVGGVAIVTRGSNVSGITQQYVTEVGKVYKATATIGLGTASFVSFRSGISVWTATDYVTVSGAGAYEFYFVATSTSAWITVYGGAVAGETFTADNISVRKVLYNDPTGTLKLISHPTNKPRVEYDANGLAKGLLIEEARTNLVAYSDFSGDWAGKTQVSLSLNSATSITGQQDAMIATSSGTDPYIFDFRSLTAGNNYVGTVWLKGVGNTIGRSPRVWFLSNIGSVTSVVADTTPLTSEWRRYTTTANCTISGSCLFRIDFDDTGLSVAGEQVYAFGAQLEQGSFATSYIPTSGATATRSVDLASVSVSEFGYNQAQGSVVVEAETFDNSVTNHGDFALVNSGNQNDIASGSRSGGTAAGTYTAWFKAGGSAQALLTVTSAVTSNTNYKAAFCYAANDFALTVDASAIVSDTSGTVPTFADEVKIGTNTYGYLNGHIKSIKYYPVRLDDDKLKELTL